MIKSWLALGSNLDSPERQLRQAINLLRKLPQSSLSAVAPIYKNKAIGRKALPDYCNTVVLINTSLTPTQLLKQCQKIEKQQGRVRKVRWGSRTLDIDILYYGNRTIKTPKLEIPHPRIHERDFVLIPLSMLNHEIVFPAKPHRRQLK